jgi:ATP-dependent exoDNAse (exonuclease V) beta subunit
LNEALDMDVREETAEWPPGWQGKIDRLFTSPPFGEGAVATETEAVAWPVGFEKAWQERKERMENTRKRPFDIRPSHMGDEEREYKTRDPETGEPPPSTALRAGSVAHKVLERIDLKEPPPDIDGAVQAAIGDALPDFSEDERREIHDDVTQMLETFLASKTFREDIQPFEILGREVPCFLPDGKEGEQGSAEGYIDLVIRDREGILAIDYKTDANVPKPRVLDYAKQKYGRQGEVYARALSHFFDGESVRFGVAFLREPLLATWQPSGESN